MSPPGNQLHPCLAFSQKFTACLSAPTHMNGPLFSITEESKYKVSTQKQVQSGWRGEKQQQNSSSIGGKTHRNFLSYITEVQHLYNYMISELKVRLLVGFNKGYPYLVTYLTYAVFRDTFFWSQLTQFIKQFQTVLKRTIV